MSLLCRFLDGSLRSFLLLGRTLWLFTGSLVAERSAVLGWWRERFHGRDIIVDADFRFQSWGWRHFWRGDILSRCRDRGSGALSLRFIGSAYNGTTEM